MPQRCPGCQEEIQWVIHVVGELYSCPECGMDFQGQEFLSA